MFQEKVTQLLNDFLETREDLFLIDLSISETKAIKVVLDGDNGVSVEDCVAASRAIEHQFDRDVVDFSLEVTSAGATAPLKLMRQFKKNRNRTIKLVTVENENYEAELVDATDKEIKLRWKTREPKPVGKGKVTVTKEESIAYNNIKEAKVKLKF